MVRRPADPHITILAYVYAYMSYSWQGAVPLRTHFYTQLNKNHSY